ncbi:glycosyl hydrolase [Flavobacterium sp. WC2509]|uniref:glycosyl hydrolase n=1 Tax=Flavobacterium sp. WC2509 TaxID=3461406 RepID=UPI004044045B
MLLINKRYGLYKEKGCLFLFAFFLCLSGLFGQNREIATDFKEGKGASPYVIWQWMNGLVTKKGITYDLEAYKKVGITNVQQFLIGSTQLSIEDPENTVFSDKWLDLMQYTLAESKRLGFDFGTHNCPGWSSSGAPGLDVAYSMQKVICSKTTVSGKQSKEKIIAKGEVSTEWNYYKDICIIAIPSGKKELKKEDLIIITNGLDAKDRLIKALPQGEWTVLRFGHTTTGHRNETAPLSGQGLEVDKLSKEALDHFWELYPGKLLKAMGEHAGTTFKRIEIDSYEAGNQDWTPNMAAEFKQRSGYDLLPWLITREGFILESNDHTRRFKNDWSRVINELFAQNYYGHLEELVHKTPGLNFLVEPYGTGKKNFDDSSIRGIGDMVMCEFWASPATWGWSSILPVASNAHLNGQKIVAAEAFTGQPQYAWQTDLADLKKDGDRAFCKGVNLFMLHACAHQPWPDLKPGMTMDWWGTQFGPSQTWWDNGAKEWVAYVTRCQLLLQKGLFESDICYLQLFSDKNAYSPKGFKADICNAKELQNRFSVVENKLQLPDGKTFKFLVLPKRGRIELETVKKIQELVNQGAVVIGEGFEGVPGLNNYLDENAEVQTISEKLFGAVDDKGKVQKSIRNIGKGKVYAGYSVDEVIALENIVKDVEIVDDKNDMDWIHRKDDNKHYYFISNQSSERNQKTIKFRVSEMKPEIWNAETGEMKEALVWENNGATTAVTVDMKPNESFFVVFISKIKDAEKPNIKSVTLNDKVVSTAEYITNNTEDTYLILKNKGTYKLQLNDGKVIVKKQNKDAEKLSLNTNWNVTFPEKLGAPAYAYFKELTPWNENPEFGIKHFAGSATYAKTFYLKSNQIKNKRITLDLGEVKNIATVTVNNQVAKVLWTPPFVLDISQYCKEGENKVEVKITNLWVNRIIGDKYEPEDCKWGPMRTFTYVDPNPSIGRNLLEIPDWVKNNTQRPSTNRITFSTLDFFDKSKPLLRSGLIGPVTVVIEELGQIKN